MQTIILAMQRQAVAQGIIKRLLDNYGVRAIHEADYIKALNKALYDAENSMAATLLFEVQESGVYSSEYCLALCVEVRNRGLGGKTMLLCPEEDESCVLTVVDALRNGQIDDFFFYDASIEYIASKLATFTT